MALAAALAFEAPAGRAAGRRRHRRPRAPARLRGRGRRGRAELRRPGPGPGRGRRVERRRGRRPRGRGPGGPLRAPWTRAADRLGAAAVLLGHTRDDQAETVLLGLARGLRRPVARRDGRRAAAATAGRCSDLPAGDPCRAAPPRACTWWDDPHNDDPAFARVRVRARPARLSSATSAPGSPPRWPAPPTCCAPTPTPSTAGRPTAAAEASPGGGRGWTSASWRRCPPAVRTPGAAARARSTAGCPAGRPGTPATSTALRPAGHRLARAGPAAPARRRAAACRRACGHRCRALRPDRPHPRRPMEREHRTAWTRRTWEPTSRRCSSPRSRSSTRLAEMAAEIDADYEGKDLLLVGVLKGAVMVMADLARALQHRTSRWTGWRCRPTARAPSPPASCASSRTSTPTSPAGTC